MFVKSIATTLSLQLRNARLLHASPLAAKWPLGKNGKPLTPFIKFSNEKRSEIQALNPQAGVPDIGRKLGEAWRQLPEAERQRYKEEYAKAKGGN